ncbi:MAG: DUF2063 domain-containing protein [Alphaproteobacteria bacterium HGW-Alphaproteobacteria-11]|nr:MAG: DUF2063 domain-containing protein [Alphaproteobacteria bacterium HGW-Alphaproteobacteria-11]
MAEGLTEFQAAFAAALSGQQPMPAMLHARPGSPSIAKRFDVYRNNVHVSLINALEAAFPAVERLVGREFFRAAARVHLEQGFPGRGTLIGYGEGFPEFLAGFPPARTLPYLADVARLELLWLEAYHAADATALTHADFSSMSPDRVASAQLALHPSLRLFASDYPTVDIWRTNRDDETVRPVNLGSGAENWLLLRPGTDVRLYRLSPEGFRLVSALRAGHSLGKAIDALPDSAGTDLPTLLGNLIEWGAFSALHLESFIVSRKK